MLFEICTSWKHMFTLNHRRDKFSFFPLLHPFLAHRIRARNRLERKVLAIFSDEFLSECNPESSTLRLAYLSPEFVIVKKKAKSHALPNVAFFLDWNGVFFIPKRHACKQIKKLFQCMLPSFKWYSPTLFYSYFACWKETKTTRLILILKLWIWWKV